MSMLSRRIDLQTNADKCRRMADAAGDPGEKETWLFMARSLNGLIRDLDSAPGIAPEGDESEQTAKTPAN